MLAVNVGHRDYGYKSCVKSYVPVEAPKPEAKNTIINCLLVAGGVTLAYLVIDPSIVEAATPYIDTSPIDRLTDIIYSALLKVSLYIATPLLAWSGITLATSGTNTGRRTTAKEIGKWTIVGIGVIVAAPWAASTIYKIWNGVF